MHDARELHDATPSLRRPAPRGAALAAWLWPTLAVAAFACGPPAAAPAAPTPPEQTSVDEAERRHVTECAHGLVAHADVLRVAWSRYRGRPALAVSLSSPNDDLVDAYYGGGQGCDLVALVGGGPLDAEVQPGAPFRSLAEARRAALATQDGFITSWALERDDDSEGRWAYRFDVDAEGHMRAVFIDALSARPLRAQPAAPPAPEPARPPPSAVPTRAPREPSFLPARPREPSSAAVVGAAAFGRRGA